jgi:hypothetical protein
MFLPLEISIQRMGFGSFLTWVLFTVQLLFAFRKPIHLVVFHRALSKTVEIPVMGNNLARRSTQPPTSTL